MADIRKAEAVVIKHNHFSDTSLLITFYTDRFGKTRVIAKGARREKSPLGGKLDLFMRCSIVFYYGRGDLHTLKECETVASYRGIRDDLDRIVAASYIAEIIDGLTVAGDSDRTLYALLTQSLDAVNASGRAASVAACYALKLLARLGNFPQYGSCARCGAGLEGERFFDGSAFRCALCSAPSSRISAGTVRVIGHVLSHSGSGLGALMPSRNQLKELIDITSGIFKTESGRRMRTSLEV